MVVPTFISPRTSNVELGTVLAIPTSVSVVSTAKAFILPNLDSSLALDIILFLVIYIEEAAGNTGSLSEASSVDSITINAVSSLPPTLVPVDKVVLVRRVISPLE